MRYEGHLHDDDWAGERCSYCDGLGACRCDELVRCVEVRAGEPQHIEDARVIGELVYLEQHDVCGACRYAVELGGVRCIGDDPEDEDPLPGCGLLVPFQTRPAREVCF
jgi:hypothetical protein